MNCVRYTKSPKGVTKRDFALFASKVQHLSKNVCYKVSLCETANGKVETTSFLNPLSNGP